MPTRPRDRKSTRLNSSHMSISYAVFCLKTPLRPPRPTLFPYTTLFRSARGVRGTVRVSLHGTSPTARRTRNDGMQNPVLTLTNAAPTSSHPNVVPSVAIPVANAHAAARSEEHTSELQSHVNIVCRLLLENATPSPQTYPLSLHDALPICSRCARNGARFVARDFADCEAHQERRNAESRADVDERGADEQPSQRRTERRHPRCECPRGREIGRAHV